MTTGSILSKKTIKLKPGEYLTNFHGRMTDYITGLTFETSRGRSIEVGGHEGKVFKSSLQKVEDGEPVKNAIISLGGSVG